MYYGPRCLYSVSGENVKVLQLSETATGYSSKLFSWTHAKGVQKTLFKLQHGGNKVLPEIAFQMDGKHWVAMSVPIGKGEIEKIGVYEVDPNSATTKGKIRLTGELPTAATPIVNAKARILQKWSPNKKYTLLWAKYGGNFTFAVYNSKMELEWERSSGFPNGTWSFHGDLVCLDNVGNVHIALERRYDIDNMYDGEDPNWDFALFYFGKHESNAKQVDLKIDSKELLSVSIAATPALKLAICGLYTEEGKSSRPLGAYFGVFDPKNGNWISHRETALDGKFLYNFKPVPELNGAGKNSPWRGGNRYRGSRLFKTNDGNWWLTTQALGDHKEGKALGGISKQWLRARNLIVINFTEDGQINWKYQVLGSTRDRIVPSYSLMKRENEVVLFRVEEEKLPDMADRISLSGKVTTHKLGMDGKKSEYKINRHLTQQLDENRMLVFQQLEYQSFQYAILNFK